MTAFVVGDAADAVMTAVDDSETVVGKAIDERGCCCDAGRW